MVDNAAMIDSMKKKLMIFIVISLLINPKLGNTAAEPTPGTLVPVHTGNIPVYLYNAANAFSLPVELLYAICKVESNCNPKAVNRNDGTAAEKSAGIRIKSYGLFQIKVTTAESLGFKSKTTDVVEFVTKSGRHLTCTKKIDHSKDLMNPTINAWYAAKLIRKLYNKYYNTRKVLSAYNAGHATHHNKNYVEKVYDKYINQTIDDKMSYGSQYEN